LIAFVENIWQIWVISSCCLQWNSENENYVDRWLFVITEDKKSLFVGNYGKLLLLLESAVY